jgi:hypothetical protein
MSVTSNYRRPESRAQEVEKVASGAHRAELDLGIGAMDRYRSQAVSRIALFGAISNASIATSHAVVSCSDLGSVKICRLASSSVRSVLPRARQWADRAAYPRTRHNSAVERRFEPERGDSFLGGRFPRSIASLSITSGLDSHELAVQKTCL